MIMAYIPEEIVFEILVQLPVLSLLRFKCVSKRLRDLIDSTYFVKSHLKLSNNSHSMMIFLQTDTAYYSDLDAVLNPYLPPALKEVVGPWGENCCDANIFLGVCNGLLCVYKYHCDYVFLWNPLTRKHVQVAVPRHLLPLAQFTSSWGFGYHSDSDDYRVVIRTASSLTKRWGLWVYSLKLDLWDEFDDCPYLDVNWWRWGVFANGALHWLVFPLISRIFIAALDLGNFHWRQLDAPHWIRADGYFLAALDGCLHAQAALNLYNYMQIWVMNEYGVNEPWKKQFTWYSCSFRGLRPLAYPAGNERQMLFNTQTSEVIVYDFVTCIYERIDHWRSLNLGKPLVFIPTLVNPHVREL